LFRGFVPGLRGGLIAAVLAILAGLAGVFTMPVLDRDEGRYAQASAQMLESGDFIRINYMDAPRNKKPAGIHWLQAASVSLVSDVEARGVWAYRLPSLVGAALAAFACFLAGRALLGTIPAAAGSCLFAVCLLLGTEAGIAKTDGALVAASTLMMAALARVKFAGGGRWAALGFWLAMAAGVLIKGPIAPLLAALTIGALIVWERRAAWLRPLLSWPGPVLFAALILPWFVAVELSGQGFLREAVGVDFAPKLVSATEDHWGPPGYHTLALLLQAWPATLFLIPGLVLAWRAARAPRTDDSAAPYRFLLAWAIPFFIVLELTPTKLSHYGLPAYPAFALLAGAGFAALLDGARMKRAETASSLIFILGALAWIAAAIALAFIYGDTTARTAAIVCGALTLVCAGAALPTRRSAAGLALALLAALIFHAGARGLVAPHLAPFTLSRRIAALIPPEARPAATTDYREPSLVFQLGGDVEFLAPEEMAEAARAARFASYAAPRALAPDVEAALVQSAGCADVLGEVSGLNYSNGDPVDLVVLAPGTAC
jgi:4-amino-4-deoxy-L-arabinose transferase-like glycosyltransferase